MVALFVLSVDQYGDLLVLNEAFWVKPQIVAFEGVDLVFTAVTPLRVDDPGTFTVYL